MSASVQVSSFGQRLHEVFASSGHLCVGIDPHGYLLEEWALRDDANGLREFGLRVVDAAVGRVGIVKPQVAFFERHGSAGLAALEVVMSAARAAGLLVIADAKRGDVGSTVEAYAEAWLAVGSPLEADAMTISAFQGVGSLEAPFRLATSTGKGLFVLVATSNPESVALQTAVLATGPWAGRTVAAGIVADVQAWNQEPLGSVGVVIGATVSLDDYGIDAGELAHAPILAPGFGHQGASLDSLFTIYGSASANVVVNSSRALLAAGPSGLPAAIAAQSDVLAEVYAA